MDNYVLKVSNPLITISESSGKMIDLIMFFANQLG